MRYYAEIRCLEPDSWYRDSDTKDIFYRESIKAIIESSVNTEISVAISLDEIDVNDYEIDEDDITIVSPASLSLNCHEMKIIEQEAGYFKY